MKSNGELTCLHKLKFTGNLISTIHGFLSIFDLLFNVLCQTLYPRGVDIFVLIAADFLVRLG